MALALADNTLFDSAETAAAFVAELLGTSTDYSIVAATFHDSGGGLLGVVAAAHDVTELRKVEAELIEANFELERANLAKNRFLASMSHELRTPLNAIIGFTGTLLLGLSGSLNPEQVKQVRTVQASGEHLLSLINDLLDLVKIESGKVDVSIQPVVCQEVVAEVVSSLRPLAEIKGLALEVSAPKKPLIVDTDRRMLSQIFLNLTGNAVKFTEEGTVRVGLKRQAKGAQGAVFSVSDTGIGIRPENHDRLFNAFEQMGESVTQRYDGTGLGLYISQKLSALLGARLAFDSEYGKGSTFWLEFGPR